MDGARKEPWEVKSVSWLSSGMVKHLKERGKKPYLLRVLVSLTREQKGKFLTHLPVKTNEAIYVCYVRGRIFPAQGI